MIVANYQDVPGNKVEKVVYKGQTLAVTGITIRWLSKAGKGVDGGPAYGLRHFTAEPGGHIPIHSHFYSQTMFMLSGSFECLAYDPDTDQVVESRVAGPGDSVYVPGQVPHGMRNLSDTEAATFLCCICDVSEDQAA